MASSSEPNGGSPTPQSVTYASAPRWAVVGIFLLLLIGGLAYARSFLMPTVLAFLLALVFSPVRRFLDRNSIPAGISAFLITGGLLVVLAVSLFALATPVSGWIDQAPSIGREIEQKLRGLSGAAAEMQEVAEQVENLAAGTEDPSVQEVVVREPGFASTLAFLAPAVVAQAVFTLILLFFLLASGDMFYEKLVHVLPTFKDKLRAIRIARDIERKLSRYLFTITVINAALGVAIAIAMAVLGMPNPILLGSMAFLMNFVPYLGAVVGLAVSLVVGLVGLPDARDAILAALVYFLLTSVEGQFITPYFVGRSLRLNTVVVFLSVTLWAWLWSVVGMLVATPLLVTIRTFCEHIPALQPVGDFLSERGAEAEDSSGAAEETAIPPPG